MKLVATFFKQLSYCLVVIFSCRLDLDFISRHDVIFDQDLTLLDMYTRFCFETTMGGSFYDLSVNNLTMEKEDGSSSSVSMSHIVFSSNLVSLVAVDVEGLSVLFLFFPPLLKTLMGSLFLAVGYRFIFISDCSP